MEFYRIGCIFLGGLLTACSTQSPEKKSADEGAVIDSIGRDSFQSAPGQFNSDALAFTNLADLLEFRQRVCLAPPDNPEFISKEPAELSQNELFAQLMIATCALDRTPGRLANLLVEAQTLRSLPPGFQALVDLLSDQYGAYRMLEVRLQETRAALSANEERLEKTIEGIRAIDAQMYREPTAESTEDVDQ